MGSAILSLLTQHSVDKIRKLYDVASFTPKLVVEDVISVIKLLLIV